MLPNSMEPAKGKNGSMWERADRMGMDGIESLEGCKLGKPTWDIILGLDA